MMRFSKKCDCCENDFEVIYFDGDKEHKLCSECKEKYVSNN